jgi:hypothetical protein
VRGGAAVFVHEDSAHPAEIYALDPGKPSPRRLTQFNDALLAGLDLGRTESREIAGANGDKIQMWVTYPPGFDPSKKYPLVQILHGGPHTMARDDFFLRWNPHVSPRPDTSSPASTATGSTGFGEKFAQSINLHWGDWPTSDVLAATEELARLPGVDGERVAAAGGQLRRLSRRLAPRTHGPVPVSRGPRRRERPVRRVRRRHHDVHFRREDLGRDALEGPGGVPAAQPIAYAKDFKTPILITAGESDYRVPYGNAIELYGVLRVDGCAVAARPAAERESLGHVAAELGLLGTGRSWTGSAAISAARARRSPSSRRNRKRRAERMSTSPGSKQVVLVASGDSRLSANQRCWPAQQTLERAVERAFGELGARIVRGHPYDAEKKHGFIDGQARGIQIFRKIDPHAPLVVAEAVWEYTSHVLAGLTKHKGPILTLANWSGEWPGLVGMLNVNASLTKAGIPYSSIWSEDFEDGFARNALRRWLESGRIEHDKSHARAVDDETFGRAMKPIASAASRSASSSATTRRFSASSTRAAWGCTTRSSPTTCCTHGPLQGAALPVHALRGDARGAGRRRALTLRLAPEARHEVPARPRRRDRADGAAGPEGLKMYDAAVRMAHDFGCAAIGIQYQQG